MAGFYSTSLFTKQKLLEGLSGKTQLLQIQEIYEACLHLSISSITISVHGGNDDSQCSTIGNDYTRGSFNPLVAFFVIILAFLVFFHLLLVIFYTCARCFLSHRPRQHGHQAQRPERGLDPTAMAFLPTFVFKEWGDCNQEDPTKCAVCLSMLEQEDMARLLPNCNHIFHAQCIEDWLIRGQSTCPICRAQVTPHHLNSLVVDVQLAIIQVRCSPPFSLLQMFDFTLLSIITVNTLFDFLVVNSALQSKITADFLVGE
ncbi:hypothetical protein Ancab_023680 [Ancistrocladus abbreviatus]